MERTNGNDTEKGDSDSRSFDEKLYRVLPGNEILVGNTASDGPYRLSIFNVKEYLETAGAENEHSIYCTEGSVSLWKLGKKTKKSFFTRKERTKTYCMWTSRDEWGNGLYLNGLHNQNSYSVKYAPDHLIKDLGKKGISLNREAVQNLLTEALQPYVERKEHLEQKVDDVDFT